jgi:CRISPR/Cas system CSM-associated protein Csm3 (group 7 of RAMP superfamily)
MAKHFATLIWDWRPVSPLVTGYSQNLAQATRQIERGAREVINLQTHDASADHTLRASLQATSVKGVFRSAAEWLVERVAAEMGAKHFVTCGYGLAVPESKQRQLGISQRSGLCPVCQVFGGTGCLSGREVVPAQRQVGHARFSFNAANDATYGRTAKSPRYQFAWEQVEHTGKPLLIEQLQFEPDTVLEARVEDADDFALALLWLVGDLISSGFFRFGRFTSRGYGVVRLQPRACLRADLNTLLSGAEPKAQALANTTSGHHAAQAFLHQEALAVVTAQVRVWVESFQNG